MSIPEPLSDKHNELIELREKARLGGGVRRIESQHAKGKFTARERIEMLLDNGTFEETDQFVQHRSTEFGLEEQRHLGDSVVTGFGKINGRIVFLYSQDFTVMGGSLSEAAANKICKVMDHAANTGAPMIGLIDSAGARIQEGIDSLAGYSDIFLRNTRMSGVIPQISVIMGPAAGGATYSPALTDFIFMVSGIGQMYITGPDVIKSVTGETVSHEELGGATSHASKSGVAHFEFGSEQECISQIQRLISFLPQNNTEEVPTKSISYNQSKTHDSTQHELRDVIPNNPNQPYDMKDIIHRVIDDEDFLEVHQSYAPNIIVGFARMEGRSVGIVGNQPAALAGVLDIDASIKAARFVRFCDAFNVPLITFVDVPGFLPGTHQEFGGIIRHGAKLIYAYAEATVPKISILIRKAYGGAYIVMSSKNLKSDVNLAWPSGEVAVMGAEGAVNVVHRRQIDASEEPQDLRTTLVQEYRDRLMNPYIAASRGLMDDVIDPSETRFRIVKSLDMLANKREPIPPKKHGNIPL